MTISVHELLATAGFPLYAIHPRHWSGASFVGNVARDRKPEPWLHTVQFVYLDGLDAAGGATVSNIHADLVTGKRGVDADPFAEHLLGFAARFEPRFLSRFMRSGATPVEPGNFHRRDLTLVLAGAERAVHWYTHRDLPLQFVRTAVRVGDGITDLVIAGWNHNARDLCAIVEPVTGDVALVFDGGARAPYPPPEWGAPDA